MTRPGSPNDANITSEKGGNGVKGKKKIEKETLRYPDEVRTFVTNGMCRYLLCNVGIREVGLASVVTVRWWVGHCAKTTRPRNARALEKLEHFQLHSVKLAKIGRKAEQAEPIGNWAPGIVVCMYIDSYNVL